MSKVELQLTQVKRGEHRGVILVDLTDIELILVDHYDSHVVFLLLVRAQIRCFHDLACLHLGHEIDLAAPR